jgi:hypothetical protein
MTGHRPILCLDFDGVLHSYVSGWQGVDKANDGPVPGAVEFLRDAVDVFDVQVYGSRSKEVAGIEVMRAQISWWIIDDLGPEEGSRVFRALSFPENKPPCFLSLDDRCVEFRGIFPDAKSLLAFRPWNKSDE